MKVRLFSLAQYLDKALEQAKYSVDEQGLIVAKVPGASGFFTQGQTRDEARENLRDVIEGNVLLALQLGLKIPPIKGVRIKERPSTPTNHGKTHSPQGKRRRA